MPSPRRSTRTTRSTRALAIALAAGALAAPAAVASPTIGPVIRDAQPVETQQAPVIVRTLDPGFDWGSAAIGAGGAGALVVLVSLGGVAFSSRNRDRVRVAR